MPQQNKTFTLLWHIKGLRRAKHTVNTTAARRQGKVEQVYIKSKCGHNILIDTVNCWTQ